MFSYVSYETAAAQDSFTIGQAYRMNVDSLSWINWLPGLAGALDVRARTGPRKTCSADPQDDRPCPPLNLDPRP